MTEPHVLVERDGPVTTITLNRPEIMNALSAQLVDDLTAGVRAAETDGTRVVVLRGAGRAFCSGADLGSGSADIGLIDACNTFVTTVTESDLPVVSVIHGPAVGMGVSIALAADLPIASTAGYFSLAFTRIGLMPDGGASALVAAGIGRAAVQRMALLGERVSGKRAAELGLIAAVTEPDELEAEVARVVSALEAGAPGALARTKNAVNAATLGGLPAALDREKAGQTALLDEPDFAEGVAAFQQKRPPEFGARQ